MQESDSNWVYVVSLGSGVPKGWKISWIDIVESEHRYSLSGRRRWLAEDGAKLLGMALRGQTPRHRPHSGLRDRARRSHFDS